MHLKFISLLSVFAGVVMTGNAIEITSLNSRSVLSLKVPGNEAKSFVLNQKKLTGHFCDYALQADTALPVSVYQKIEKQEGNANLIHVYLTALDDVYFNFAQQLNTEFPHGDALFYMPGFWYRKNLRSPENAPSFHSSDSWTVREDRLSTPLTGIFYEKTGEYVTVTRLDDFKKEALTTHSQGDVVVSGETSIGYTGFVNDNGTASLSFGFPYHEYPKTYLRKLTLAPATRAFQKLPKGKTIHLTWKVQSEKSNDFAGFVKNVWEYSYDTYRPEKVDVPYSNQDMKEVMSSYFTESFVAEKDLKYTSGVHLETDNCRKKGSAEVGFVGRVLLNAFNAYEYGLISDKPQLIADSREIWESYLNNGFSPAGFFHEFVDFNTGYVENTHSIRRQSEGVTALLHYLQFEKQSGKKHPEWEAKIKGLLDQILLLQQADGSLPRKFTDDLSVSDKSGGSTPSATIPLVMGYKYFKDKRYLVAARKTADYLEKELISKSDYFSSTLDANCEDKEASLYAATAMYYLALVSKGDERRHYADLCRQASYFALSWYYVWDVPFATGQMLGDLGLKTRGWGNVSVENNHIDVFVFEFGDVLNWLSKEYQEPRFSRFASVIESSMKQLLPHEGHACGIAKRGFYPEVVQHTNWDYGRNGKGFYNDIFAPGWTVASLWELFSPGRAEIYLKN
ncbi:MAG: hypothetical protein RR346_01990 [Bacteroidales bacterium]